MDINSGAGLSEPKRRSGVIEMNMAKEDTSHVSRFDPEFFQCADDVVKRGLGARIEEYYAIACFQNSDRNDPGSTELERINNVKSQEQLAKLKTENGKAEKPKERARLMCRP
jgi:hypothetical protein